MKRKLLHQREPFARNIASTRIDLNVNDIGTFIRAKEHTTFNCNQRIPIRPTNRRVAPCDS